MPSLGLRLPLSGSGCRPPASLPPVGDRPVHSQLALLWCLLNPLFCERARLCLRAFHGKVLSLSFFLLSLAIPQFGLLSHISSFRLSSGHSGQVLTLRMQPMTPLLAGGRHEHLGYSLLGIAVKACILWIILFLLVMLPSEIPKLPTDLPMRGFPGVWKLLLLHNSLPRTGLCP